MKHSGKARKEALKLILKALLAVVAILAVGTFAAAIRGAIVTLMPFLVGLWAVFTLFTLYFFRDPEARPPAGEKLVVSPGHGTVDAIGPASEPQFLGGDCQRISIFLSVFNVHVQN